MNKAENIFLIGPMGAGKTTIGRMVARALGKFFYDSDHEIEINTGVSIPWIFDIEGEAGFRMRERDLIAKITGMKNIVLATGGGVVIMEENRYLLSQRGQVIYLQVDLKEQLQRVKKSKHRPLIQTTNPAERLAKLNAIREPLYRSIADFIVETDTKGVLALTKEIVDWYLQNPI